MINSDKNILKTLGNTIRSERKLRGMSSQTLADMTGISRMTLYRLENGEPSVKIGAYADAIEALNLSLVLKKETVSAKAHASLALPSRINLSEYPKLQSLCWRIPYVNHISPSVAYNLYARHKHSMDSEQLTDAERDLIATLEIAFFDEQAH